MSKFVVIPLLALSLISISCEGPQGPPGHGYGGLDDPSVMPMVIYTYPPLNSQGPYPDFYVTDCPTSQCPFYSIIQIRFNKFMDIASVRRAISITSASGNIRTDSNNVVAVGGDVFLVTPTDSNGSTYSLDYRVGQKYFLSVDTSARDVNGNRLRPGFVTSFEPEPFFRVLEMTPEDHSTNVNVGTSVYMTFNSDIDSSLAGEVILDPPVSTNAYRSDYDPKLLYVTFPDLLMNGTEYTLTLPAGATDAEGHPTPYDFTSQFRTVDFRYTGSSPWSGQTGVFLSSRVYLYFTSGIDSAASANSFSIDPPTEGRFEISPRSQTVVFDPARGLRSLTPYVVRIDTTLRSKDGLPLPGPVEVTFTTDAFRVTSTNPSDGRTGVSPSVSLRVSTNGPLDSAAVFNSIRFDPDVGVGYLYVNPTYFTFTPASTLRQATTYTVTIDSSLSTLAGDRLARPYSFSFTTAGTE